MKRLLLSLLILFLTLALSAQGFRGRVTSDNGEPIPYAALYLREISSGFVTDDNGYFQTTLPSGKYTCEVSSLGYNKQVITIQVPVEGLTLNITLKEHLYHLKEVEITQSKEDPAYAVVRQAIAHAPKYRYRVSTYTANTYLKGSGKLNNIPSILMISKEIRELTHKYKDKTFLLEEQRKVIYTAPNTWDNEVLAYSNTFPPEITVLLESTDVNLYRPTMFWCVSPISSGAFNYYNYKLEGCVTEGDYLINKIKVIPKKDNPELLSGFIYIVENLWSLSGVDISLNGNGMTADIKVTCNEVKPSLFLTTSISIENTFSMFGVKAEAAYLSSIKYLDIKVDNNSFITALDTQVPVNIASNLNPKQQKTLSKINELQSKNSLSTREAYRLSKLLDKSIQQADTARSKYKYERKARDYNMKRDSMATRRDSLYWEDVRSVPLSEEEQESYAYKKVLDADSLSQGDKKASGFGEQLMQTLLVGKTYQTKNKKAWITLKNALSIIPEYNFVDGLWVGATFTTGYKINNQTKLQFTPQVHYTIARKEWVGSGTLSLDYAPRRLGKLWIKAGSASADFNTSDGEPRIINSLSSLIFGRSDIKFYNRKYLTAGNQVELTNSLLFTSVIDWERREALDNHTHKSIFKKRNKQNIPDNRDYFAMPVNNLLKATFSLSYTPEHYYRMIHGKKVYENSLYPTFSVLYQQAFSQNGDKITPEFKKAEVSIEQKVEFGMFNNLYWYINGGLLWDKNDIQFPDFKHFSTTRLPVTDRNFFKGFSLLNNYEMSTNTRWVQANVMWSTPYLLFKHLPFLRRKPFDEALHLRSLIVYDKKAYTELGYSVGVMDIGRIGVFVGFKDFNYKTIGFSISLPMLRTGIL